MTEVIDGIASIVEQLSERVRQLEARVSELESRSAQAVFAPSVAVSTPQQGLTPTVEAIPGAEKSTGAVPVLGKAVLGIAGAYLLRAIAESGATPKLPVLMVAILYAGFWMVWAARTHTANRFASATYGVTSALILAPLLWESTLRFQVLSPVFTGAVLVAFVTLALALCWRRDLHLIPWVATLTAITAALALIVATHAIVPLTAALLAIALVTEITACLGHQLGLRVAPAFAADLSVALLLFLMTMPDGVPEGFSPAAASTITALCLALFAIYGASIATRSFVLGRRFTIFEIVQGVLVFSLATIGALRASHDSIAPALGVLFLLLAAVCYWGTLSRFTDESHTRNRRVSASWAAGLLLVGSLLLFPASFEVPFLCLAAVVSALLYTRTGKFSLGLHASIFLLAATALSPLPNYVMSALAGTVPPLPRWGVWLMAIAAALCYGVGARRVEDKRRRRTLWVVPALLAGFAAAALVVDATVWLVGGRLALAASRLSVVRTIVNCALALGLGLLGARWKRVELGWVAYTAVAFGTLKLLFEDLRFGNPASLVVSLLFYGLVLILLPRLTRQS